ncbi:MAG: tetratricopeptide repeat protein [Chitinispirillaceae bacterium]|nr:tetratricopeptide repeat protein [Chitinispirillaceae bacterium]
MSKKYGLFTALTTFLLAALLPCGTSAQELFADADEISAPAERADRYSIMVARPAAGDTKISQEFAWIAPFLHEFVLFRLGAVAGIRLIEPDTLAVAVSGYRSYQTAAPAPSVYLSKADAHDVTHLLVPGFRLQNNNRAVTFSMVVIPVNGQGNEISVQSSAVELNKIDEGIDASVAQLLSGLRIEGSPAVQKFMKTRIAGGGKCDKSIGSAVAVLYGEKKQNPKNTADELKKCAGQDESAPLAFYLSARYYAAASDYDNASKVLKDLIFKLGPTNAALYPLCASYFRKAKKQQEALGMVKVAEGLNLVTNDLILEKALLLEEMEEEDDAAAAWREVLSFDPSNFNALLFLMQKSNSSQDATGAIDYANRFRQRYPNDGRGDLEAGKAYLAVMQYPDAQAALAKAADILTADAQPRILLGDVFAAQYNFTAALDQYERALEFASENIDLQVKIAQACLSMGKPEMAVETLRKMQKKHYDHGGLLKTLGLAEYQTGDTVAARKTLGRYTQSSAPDRTVFFTLGEICDNAGEYAEALEYYERAAALDESDQQVRLRIDEVKGKMAGDDYAARVQKKKEKRESAERSLRISPRITIATLSGVLGVGSVAGGYIMNMLMKKDYDVYRNFDDESNTDARTTERVAELRKSIDQKMLYRNILYGFAGLCGVSVTLTFVIP